MNQILMYGTFGFLGLVVVCWIFSMVQVAKRGKASIWMSRGIYIFGLAAVVLNLIRMALVFEEYKGTMIFANVIALFCILIAYVRAEREYRSPSSGQNAEEE